MKRFGFIVIILLIFAFSLTTKSFFPSSISMSSEIVIPNENQDQADQPISVEESIRESKLDIPFYKMQLTMNYSVGVEIVPQYLVIHETNNTGVGADADAHYRYWNTNKDANASTHFVVDSTQIYQMLELNQKAWHVGDNRGYSDITNDNSIGIEIAVNADGDYTIARQNAIELTIQTMKQLNMDISQLKRHYDASGKNCPTIMLENPSLWTDFVSQVEAGLRS